MAYNKADFFKILYLCNVLSLNNIGGNSMMVKLPFNYYSFCIDLVLLLTAFGYYLPCGYINISIVSCHSFFSQVFSSCVLKPIHSGGSWSSTEV